MKRTNTKLILFIFITVLTTFTPKLVNAEGLCRTKRATTLTQYCTQKNSSNWWQYSSTPNTAKCTPWLLPGSAAIDNEEYKIGVAKTICTGDENGWKLDTKKIYVTKVIVQKKTLKKAIIKSMVNAEH